MTEQQLAAMRQWAENVSKAYDLTAWGHTERAAEILRQTRDAIRTAIKQAEQPQCNWPNCPYPCPDLPDCKDAEQQPIIQNTIKKDNSEQQPAQGQHDMPKLGCVNHDCDQCKAAPVWTLEECKKAIDTLNYIQGIVERGEGRPMRDDEALGHFVLGYVKKLETAHGQEPVDERTLIRKMEAELAAIGLESYTTVHNSRYRLLTTVRHFLSVSVGHLPDWLLQPAQAMREATETSTTAATCKQYLQVEPAAQCVKGAA